MTTVRRGCARCGARLARDNAGLLCAPCGQSHRAGDTAPRLRAEFWRTEQMREALASRDMGAVVRAYRHHPAHGRRPLPQADVAAWLGITQGQLSRIESGHNRVREYDKLVGYARRLHIPAELLWFEAEDPPPPADRPGEGLVRLPSGAMVPPPMALSESALADALLITLRQNAVIDNLTGSHALLPVAVQQMGFIDQVLAGSQGHGRFRLLGVAARFAEYTGWLHQECGDLAAALRWSDTALELAEQAGDSALSCYIRMRKSYIATDAGRPDLAIAFAGQVVDSGPLSPRLKAFVLRQRAQGYALAGDYDGCARSLDRAFGFASDTSGDGADLVPYCTPSYIEMEAAQCWITLGRPAKALSTLRKGLGGWRPNFRRDLGLCLARLSAAHAGIGEPDQALDVARRSLPIAADTRSHRTLLQLRQATDLMVAGGAVEQAEQLRQAMAAALA